MNKPNSNLTKTCSSCGLEKPFSAFLQLSGPESNTYGSICATCRKANAENAPKETEASIRGGTAAQIDAKSRVHHDIDKKNQYQRTEELYKEDREKDEIIAAEKTEKIEIAGKDEKKHRQGFLGKRSFLDSNKAKSAPAQAVAGGEQQAAKEREIDLTAPVQDTQIAGKEKHKSATFSQFKTWLGKGAPIAGVVEKAAEQNKDLLNNPEDPLEYSEKNWGPNKKR